MDILTHTLSGLAAGTVAAGFSEKGPGNKLGIISLSGLGAALPDIDAISLWSKFDTTIGKFFGLPYPGNVIYSGKLWYSHHGFFHSLFAGVLIALTIGLVCYLFCSKFRYLSFKDLIKSFGARKLLFIGFLSGFVLHLIEDMPTPASTWGGVRLFWPAGSYIGGTGQIWWWNNYDIFLIAMSVLLVNMTLLVVNHFQRTEVMKKIAAGVFIAGFALATIQVNTRNYDFAYSGHTCRYQEFEAASKRQQEKILGKRLFNTMEGFDKTLPVHF